MAKKQVTTSFQPDPEIMSVLKEQAVIQDRSVSWLVNHYIRKALEAENLLPSKKLKKEGKKA